MYINTDASSSDFQCFPNQGSAFDELENDLDEQDQLESTNEGNALDDGGNLGAAFEERLLEELLSVYQHAEWFDKHGVVGVIEEKPFLQASEASIQRILSAAVKDGVLDIQEGSGRRPHKRMHKINYRFLDLKSPLGLDKVRK